MTARIPDTSATPEIQDNLKSRSTRLARAITRPPILFLWFLLLLACVYPVNVEMGAMPNTRRSELLVLQRFLHELKWRPFAIRVTVKWQAESVLEYDRLQRQIRWCDSALCTARQPESRIHRRLRAAIEMNGSGKETPYEYFISGLPSL